MPRVKSISAKRHRQVKSAARGFRDARRKRVKVAKESLLHAGQYAYNSRRLKKRDFRKLWITRLNAAVREHDLTYSKFVKALKNKKIEIDRKILADIAINDPDTFGKIISEVK